jgi:hypothetical protein
MMGKFNVRIIILSTALPICLSDVRHAPMLESGDVQFPGKGIKECAIGCNVLWNYLLPGTQHAVIVQGDGLGTTLIPGPTKSTDPNPHACDASPCDTEGTGHPPRPAICLDVARWLRVAKLLRPAISTLLGFRSTDWPDRGPALTHHTVSPHRHGLPVTGVTHADVQHTRLHGDITSALGRRS